MGSLKIGQIFANAAAGKLFIRPPETARGKADCCILQPTTLVAGGDER
ncbi:Uncharacterised protein [Tatumella ptyseos]|uniref:Uncharacterized protein n=1 Tax=Tatumella ptyseos TaxID=82987 RepID=A0A2X5NPL8_9GAMM|nr:Uncharacterised protein [Tatumella ptyseos]